MNTTVIFTSNADFAIIKIILRGQPLSLMAGLIHKNVVEIRWKTEYYTLIKEQLALITVARCRSIADPSNNFGKSCHYKYTHLWHLE